jgi:hypothetical protein
MLCCITVFVGCDDEEGPPVLGSYTLSSVQTALAYGYYDVAVLELDDNDVPGRWYTIILTTPSLTIVGSEEQGEGDIVYLEVFSESVDDLLADTYSYYEQNVVGVFRLTVFQQFKSTANASQKVWFGESGTLTLSMAGTASQDLTFSATIEDSDTGTKLPVTGTFAGVLTKVY